MLLIPLIFHPPAPASLNGFNRPVELGPVPLSGADLAEVTGPRRHELDWFLGFF